MSNLVFAEPIINEAPKSPCNYTEDIYPKKKISKTSKNASQFEYPPKTPNNSIIRINRPKMYVVNKRKKKKRKIPKINKIRARAMCKYIEKQMQNARENK